MRFNPLSLWKKQATFDFLQVQNVETEAIKDAAHLISWAEEENVRFLEEGEIGSVVIVKRDKKDRVLYGQILEFPVDMETDFDDLLNNFYTRKPIPFDQSILEESQPIFSQPTSTPIIPEVPVSPIPNQQSAPSEIYAAVPNIEASEVAETTETELYQQSEIQELIKIQKVQQEEIEKLKQQLEEERTAAAKKLKTEQETVKRENQVNSEGAVLVVEKETSTEKDHPNEPVFGILGKGRGFYGFESSLSASELSFQDRIDLFMEQEKQKIEAEIYTVDQRDLIEAEVMSRITEEKEAVIRQVETKLYEQHMTAIEEEEKRHEAEMEKLQREYEKQLESQLRIEDDKFKRKAATEIRSEYNRQTKELKQLFDERMVELKNRQSQLSKKLMENIKATFSHLDLELEEPEKNENEQPSIPVLAELKTVRAGK